MIIELIKESSPLDFSDYKRSTILRRTKRRAISNNFTSLEAYLNFLKTTPEEIDTLAKEFLISVTSFFRDKEAFSAIQNDVLPDLLAKLTSGEELKIWVAGCATGEEAYSIAILVAEQLTGKLEDTVVKIFATDIDSTALLHAGKGVYNKGILKNVSTERIEKYFLKEGENYRIKPIIRKMLIFAQHDLVKSPPYCNMDLISCRNLLIYMAPVLQKKIFKMLLFGLKKGGYLFLGSSENPIPIIKDLEVVHKKWKIYRNLETKRGISFDTFSLPSLLDTKLGSSHFSQERAIKKPNQKIGEMIHENLAHQLNYFAVCINEDNQVIKSYGNPTKYLLPKHFTSDLVALLPRPLAVAVSTLNKKVLATNETLALSGITVKQGEAVNSISISVSPLFIKDEEKLFLVVFNEEKSGIQAQNAMVYNEKVYLDQYVVNLEEELKELKEKLSYSNERLDASNENLQSFNEELISANEEMQSTNEEMQSVNEELHTINSDYQLKNKELLEINDDLNNYFRSNINGQLFIDNDLRLMKFSPGTTKQINLLETDIGRPLSNISTNIKFETIIDDIKKVLDEGCVVTKEIQTNNGKWYQIMTMPYVQQADHKNTGAIITFNDITELKDIQQELNTSNKMLGIAIESAAMGIWSIDVKTREFIPSQRLKDIFGFRPDEEMSYQASIAQIAGESYQTLVRSAVEASIGRGEKYDIEYPIKGFDDGKLRWVRGVGDLCYDKDNKPTYFTGVLHDITVHKQDEIRKNDFIAMVSHELRTPLTTLQGYIQLLSARAKKANDAFSDSALDKTNIQVKKMASLISGFLNVSSFGSGKIYLNEQDFEISVLLNEIIEETIIIAKNKNIILIASVDLLVNADRDKIGQVINNFLSNAIKYSPNDKGIEVSFKRNKDMLQVSIKDHGIGISLQHQEKLFDRYYRIEAANTNGIAGFGLGLYLSAEIIQRHNGKIWVESEKGKGSTFHFSLPLVH